MKYFKPAEVYFILPAAGGSCSSCYYLTRVLDKRSEVANLVNSVGYFTSLIQNGFTRLFER